MAEFLASLTGLEKVFAVSATVGGGVFVVRLLISLIAGDFDADTDVSDFDGVEGHHDAGFKVLSIQGLTAFFMMFGLVGLTLSRSQVSGVGSIAGGTVTGVAAMYLIGWMFAAVSKLQSSGTLDLGQAVGEEGTVYLGIPAGDVGKVELAIGGRMRVMDARCDGERGLSTGERVRVVRVTHNDMLIVERAGSTPPATPAAT